MPTNVTDINEGFPLTVFDNEISYLPGNIDEITAFNLTSVSESIGALIGKDGEPYHIDGFSVSFKTRNLYDETRAKIGESIERHIFILSNGSFYGTFGKTYIESIERAWKMLGDSMFAPDVFFSTVKTVKDGQFGSMVVYQTKLKRK